MWFRPTLSARSTRNSYVGLLVVGGVCSESIEAVGGVRSPPGVGVGVGPGVGVGVGVGVGCWVTVGTEAM